MQSQTKPHQRQRTLTERLELMKEIIDRTCSKQEAKDEFLAVTNLSTKQFLRYYKAVKEGRDYVERGHGQGKIDRNKCYFCQIDYNLEVHHIDKDWTNNKIWNILVVCSGCHAKLHAIYDKIWGLSHGK